MSHIKQLYEKDKRNFDRISKFPGEEGNPFDKVLRTLNKINKIPAIKFFLFILLLTGLLTLLDVEKWSFLFLFSIFDTFIILILPFLKISYGSYKSQVFLLLLLRSIFIWLPYPINLFLQLMGTLLVIYGFIIEPSTIRITKINKSMDKANSKLHFIHLADVHLEKFSVREGKILKIINDLNPDFILFTGDFLSLSHNRDPDSINQVINLFNQINSLVPVYYVSGSPAVDIEEIVVLIQDNISASRLHNEKLIIVKNDVEVNLIGVTCTHKPQNDVKVIPSLIEKDKINILMYHSPDLIYEIKREDQIQIMLSGHTHGGQVRIPIWGAFFTGSLYGRKLQSGMYRIHDTLLYISRGIGLEGMGAPRVRFLCSPEIIEWKINLLL
jgi:predicted MPP superfamily phosphohydrolase